MKNIALIGVPIETVFIEDADGFCIDSWESYSKGLTDKIRSQIMNSKTKNLNVIDKGELDFGIISESKVQQRNFYYDAHHGMKLKNQIISLDNISEQKKTIKELSNLFDHVICIGPSHFGALLLYQPIDSVVRADFHGDYFRKDQDRYSGASYGSYMITVKRDIKPRKVVNYGWGGLDSERKEEAMDLFGEVGVIGDDRYKNATLFDIDMDCFSPDLRMCSQPNCSDLRRYQIERMISEVKPPKIGIFEYRSDYDVLGNGAQFITNVIKALE